MGSRFEIPDYDEETELLTYTAYCPLNIDGVHTCRKRNQNMGTYDTEEACIFKIVSHLTVGEDHTFTEAEATDEVDKEERCIVVGKCKKSEWTGGAKSWKTVLAKPKASNKGGGARGSYKGGASSSRRDERSRSRTRRRRRSESRRGRRGSGSDKPPEPPAPPSAQLHLANLEVRENRERSASSTPKQVVLEALVRAEGALRSSARMARMAAQAFDEEAGQVSQSNLAMHMCAL